MGFELLPARGHPVLPEGILPSFLDFRNPFHGAEGGLHKVTVIADWDIPAFLEINSRIDNHLLPCSLPESFSPPYFAWVPFHLEVFMAFRRAEPKNLCIISNESGTMARIHAL